MKKLFFALPILFLAACKGQKIVQLPWSSSETSPVELITHAVEGGGFEGMKLLSWIGALAVAAGLVLLVITSGKKGWYPIVGGISLILLNWIVCTYAHALFIPVVVATGVLTLAWTYKTTKQILSHREIS